VLAEKYVANTGIVKVKIGKISKKTSKTVVYNIQYSL